MAATHEPFDFVAADTWKISASLHGEDGAPLDLTDATIEWFLRDAKTGELKLTLTVGDGITVDGDPTEGNCTIIVAAEDTSVSTGSYYDLIRVTLPSDFVTTQAMGQITVIDRPVIAESGQIDWTQIDWTDPCGTLATLRPKFYQVVAGGTIAKVRFGDEEVTYSSSNFASFDQLIRDLEEQCAKKQGTPRRFAMRLGARL